MAVKVREYRRRGKPMGCWEADVRLPLPSGEFYRERVRVPVSGKTSAKRWADAREAEVIGLARTGLDAEAIHAKLNGKGAANEVRVPTLAEFEKQFILRKLQQFGGNVSRAAESLGVERSNLYRKLNAYGIRVSRPA